jgi:hypothetical protein
MPGLDTKATTVEGRDRLYISERTAKYLCLAVWNLDEFRRPNVGIRNSGRKQALQAFTIYFDGRVPAP